MRAHRKRLCRPAGLIVAAGVFSIVGAASAQVPTSPAKVSPEMMARVEALQPALESYVKKGMGEFDVPGAAIGIVAGDRLVYAKGFGLRRKGGSEPIDPKTVFQIGSTTKAFLATVLAIAVDRDRLKWNDRVVDLDPSFALKDPYVTREFRLYDLLAQRSGLPPYANDALSTLGFDPAELMHSLRFVDPRTSFRSTFAYTNITHLFAGRIADQALGAPDWPTLVKREIVEPLGMHDTSFTAGAIEQAADHATGYRWTPNGSVEIPFDPIFPYEYGPAGDINSSLEDCARWLRLQIADGVFAGHRLVSARNLAVTRTPKVAINETATYAMGWIISSTPNGRVIWHNGGTNGFGAEIGFLPDKGVGVIILTNEQNKGFPDAVALWAFDRLLGNPEIDYVQKALGRAKAAAAEEQVIYERPATPRPSPELADLSGDYRSSEMGPATLVVENGGLMATLQKTGVRFRLEPYDGAVFSVHLVPEGRFAALDRSLGDTPFGFAAFVPDARARLSRLRLIVEGQSYFWARSDPAAATVPGPPRRPITKPE
ncbi:MAG TPA: serine hydrolase [Stellaceae bacterium]|nr:serine hydrolase [Stellaceae bacterium]